MSLVDRARRYKSETHTPLPETETPLDVRKVRTITNPHERSLYADQLIARVAVDLGAVRIIAGELVIENPERVAPLTMARIAEYMPDVLRSVGQMERAQEYGEAYRQAIAGSDAISPPAPPHAELESRA